MPSSIDRYRRPLSVLLLLAGVAGWVGLFAFKLRYLAQGGHQIDDSYMFYRYAQHVRQGLGLSWNMDGVHTYGMTTLLWQAIIIPFSMLPLAPATSLTLATWLTSGLSLWMLSAAIWKNAASRWLQDRMLVLGLVSVTLVMVPMFDYGSVSGMETIGGFAMLAWLLGLLVQQWREDVSPELIGLAALLLFLFRPESLLPSGLLLCLSWMLSPRVKLQSVVRSFAVIFAGVALVLLFGKWYFGSPLPLSFYLKVKNGYAGYGWRWYPFTFALHATKTSSLYLGALVLFARRRQWRLIVLTMVPLLAVGVYLCSITQIMGFHDRYFLPYLPLLMIPAFLVVDAWLAEERAPGFAAMGFGWGHGVAAVLVVLFVCGYFPYWLNVAIERHADPTALAYHQVTYDPPTVPAPDIDYFVAMNTFVDEVARPLPAGTLIAASEVGYLGVQAPQANILDLAGLNDKEIGLNGFDSKSFYQRKPDVIWFPHQTYTWQRGVMMTDPAFLANYDFYAGALSYGLAVRKNSPVRPLVEAELAAIWPKLYPGMSPRDSLVHKVEWAPGTSIPPVQPQGRY